MFYGLVRFRSMGVALGRTVVELKQVLSRHLGGDGAVSVTTIVRALDRNRIAITPMVLNFPPAGRRDWRVSPPALLRAVEDGQRTALNKLREQLYDWYVEHGVEDIPPEVFPQRSRKIEPPADRISAYVS